jgi:hypothetical protein
LDDCHFGYTTKLGGKKSKKKGENYWLHWLESASFIGILKICIMHGWGASSQGFLIFF